MRKLLIGVFFFFAFSAVKTYPQAYPSLMLILEGKWRNAESPGDDFIFLVVKVK